MTRYVLSRCDMRLFNSESNAIPAEPIPMTVGDRSLVCLEVHDYELIKERLRSQEILLALLEVLVPDLEERITRIRTKMQANAKQARVAQMLSPERAKAKRVLPQSVKERALKNLQQGEYVSASDLEKQIAIDDIRAARERAGLTQRELAERAGLTQPQLSRLEKDPKSASMTTLRKVASVLGIKLLV